MPPFLKGPLSSVHTPQPLAAPHLGLLGVLLRHPQKGFIPMSTAGPQKHSPHCSLFPEPPSFHPCLFSTQQTQGSHRPPFCSTSSSGCKQKPSQWPKHWFSVSTVQDCDLLGDCENIDLLDLPQRFEFNRIMVSGELWESGFLKLSRWLNGQHCIRAIGLDISTAWTLSSLCPSLPSVSPMPILLQSQGPLCYSQSLWAGFGLGAFALVLHSAWNAPPLNPSGLCWNVPLFSDILLKIEPPLIY